MHTYRMVQNNGELETLRTTNSSLDAQKYYFKQTILKFDKNSKETWAKIKKATTLDIQFDKLSQNQFDLLGNSDNHQFRAFEHRITGKNKREKVIKHMIEAVKTTEAEKMILHLTVLNKDSIPGEDLRAIREASPLAGENSLFVARTNETIKQNAIYLLIITINKH